MNKIERGSASQRHCRVHKIIISAHQGAKFVGVYAYACMMFRNGIAQFVRLGRATLFSHHFKS
jgi:hypothetical protein